jgi:hypothetical protein
VLKPQVVVVCVDGAAPPAAPQCSDGKDNDGDLAIDYPTDKGCDSPADTTEYPDRVSAVEQLLTSRDGFWWQQAGVDPNNAVCNLYVFRITPQGDHIGTRQAYFLNPITQQCQSQVFAPASAFTWTTSDFTPPAIGAPFTPLGTEVRIQLVAGSIVALWIAGRDDADDALAFTGVAAPTQPGATPDILWGCKSSVFPAAFRPPGCA